MQRCDDGIQVWRGFYAAAGSSQLDTIATLSKESKKPNTDLSTKNSRRLWSHRTRIAYGR